MEEKKVECGVNSRKYLFVIFKILFSTLFVSAADFLAVSVTYQIYWKIEGITKIETGTAVLLAFLFLLGIAGISGQLPFLLLQGRFPGAEQ